MDNQTNEVIDEIYESLLEKLRASQDLAKMLQNYFETLDDKDNIIRFATTGGILNDLRKNIEVTKIDSK